MALASTATGDATVHPYTLAATKACLLGLPGSLAGLPPATTPRRLFVYRFQHEPALLGVWDGNQEIDVEFLRSPLRARVALKKGLKPPYYIGTRVANAILWRGDATKKLTAAFRRTVARCLRGSPPKATPEAAEVPRATLATFAGYWGGHDRGLTISSRGEGFENTLESCCDRDYVLRYEILSVSGTLIDASATFRVTSFTRFHTYVPRISVGSSGTLRLRNGILTDMLSQVFFCSNPAWGVTGACGA
jgi:hypothetical protein